MPPAVLLVARRRRALLRTLPETGSNTRPDSLGILTTASVAFVSQELPAAKRIQEPGIGVAIPCAGIVSGFSSVRSSPSSAWA